MTLEYKYSGQNKNQNKRTRKEEEEEEEEEEEKKKEIPISQYLQRRRAKENNALISHRASCEQSSWFSLKYARDSLPLSQMIQS